MRKLTPGLAIVSVLIGTPGSSIGEALDRGRSAFLPSSTHGTVAALCQDGDVLYLGGVFRSTGPQTGCAVVVDADIGRTSAPSARVAGQVDAAIADGAGGWFVATRVPRFGASRASLIDHIDRNGRRHRSSVAVDGPVFCMARFRGDVVIGGAFQVVNGERRSRLAKFDAASGKLSKWNPDVFGDVHAIAVDGADILVGGEFSRVAGVPRRNVARVDGLRGQSESWAPEVDGRVVCLVPSGESIYLAGAFSHVNGEAQSYLARVDAGIGALTDWRPTVAGSATLVAPPHVRSIVIHEDAVYVAGFFESVNGQPRASVAALDLRGTLLEWNPRLSAGLSPVHVLTMAAVDDGILLGGSFRDVGGVSRSYAAKVGTVNGQLMHWDPRPDDVVSQVVVATNERVFLGGSFASVGPQWWSRRGLAKQDLRTGQFLDWGPELDGDVRGIVARGDRVYVGGQFTRVGDQSATNLVALDSSTGSVLPFDLDANLTVLAMASIGDTLYVGGRFTTIGSASRRCLAAVDMRTGVVLNWAPDPDGTVLAMTSSPGALYVGGTFTRLAGASRYLVGAIAPDGSPLPWAPVVDAPVEELVVGSAGVYIAGGFTTVGFQPRGGLALVDRTFGYRETWRADLVGQARALALAPDGSLYVGGAFTRIGGLDRTGLARVDGVSGAIHDWTPSLDATVWALQPIGLSLGVGGAFHQVDGELRGSYFRWPIETSTRSILPNLALHFDDVQLANVRFVPNPLDRPGTVHLSLTAAGSTSIDLFDLGGRHVRTVVARQRLEAGEHAFPIDPAALSPGAYWCRIDVDGMVTARKVVVVH
jgi:hypothetical protein